MGNDRLVRVMSEFLAALTDTHFLMFGLLACSVGLVFVFNWLIFEVLK
jgi:hypothetical protein